MKRFLFGVPSSMLLVFGLIIILSFPALSSGQCVNGKCKQKTVAKKVVKTQKGFRLFGFLRR